MDESDLRQKQWETSGVRREKSSGNDGALGISQQRDFDCTTAILTSSVTEFNVWVWRAQLMVGAPGDGGETGLGAKVSGKPLQVTGWF